eukprot:scaffold29241_cov16-Tisochrysis_lutea.AAC.2
MPQELGGAPQNLTAACLAAPAHLWQSHACRSGLEQRILEKRAGLRMFKTGSLTSHASAALGQEGGLKRKDYVLSELCGGGDIRPKLAACIEDRFPFQQSSWGALSLD